MIDVGGTLRRLGAFWKDAKAQGGNGRRVFEDPKNIVEASTLVSIHTFRLADIPHPKITVTIWKDAEAHGGNDFYRYEASHAIHAPGQADASIRSAPYADSEQAALQRATRDLTFYYACAKASGHKPDRRWIVPRYRPGDYESDRFTDVELIRP